MFGRAMSSPRAPAPPVDFSAPPAPSAICMDCDTTVFLVAGCLPIGWEEVDRRWGKAARCTSCCKSRKRPAPLEGPRVAKSAPARALVGMIPADPAADQAPTEHLYAGHRIHHWMVGGHAVLRIHGGASPRPAGRDEPIHFLATAEDLDQLIIHLAGIRRKLVEKGSRA